MARVAHWGSTTTGGRTVRLGGAWGWALAGLLVVLGAVALDPGTERPLPESGAAVGVSAPEDWRGNSARLPAAR